MDLLGIFSVCVFGCFFGSFLLVSAQLHLCVCAIYERYISILGVYIFQSKTYIIRELFDFDANLEMHQFMKMYNASLISLGSGALEYFMNNY